MAEQAKDDEAGNQGGDKIPRYRLTEKAYINDVLYEPREVRVGGGDAQTVYPEIQFRGVPGPHMVPINAAAKAMCEKHKERMKASDPVAALSVIGAAPPGS